MWHVKVWHAIYIFYERYDLKVRVDAYFVGHQLRVEVLPKVCVSLWQVALVGIVELLGHYCEVPKCTPKGTKNDSESNTIYYGSETQSRIQICEDRTLKVVTFKLTLSGCQRLPC